MRMELYPRLLACPASVQITVGPLLGERDHDCNVMDDWEPFEEQRAMGVMASRLGGGVYLGGQQVEQSSGCVLSATGTRIPRIGRRP